ncbi:hypothetical protein ASE14_09790 [Agromyces sp. Root81]|nr:hypothetical protein ASE14_09790 [Agromyces sp. Root81]
MHELRTEFDRHSGEVVASVKAAAEPITGLEDSDVESGIGETPGGGESSSASADDDDIGGRRGRVSIRH